MSPYKQFMISNYHFQTNMRATFWTNISPKAGFDIYTQTVWGCNHLFILCCFDSKRRKTSKSTNLNQSPDQNFSTTYTDVGVSVSLMAVSHVAETNLQWELCRFQNEWIKESIPSWQASELCSCSHENIVKEKGTKKRENGEWEFS